MQDLLRMPVISGLSFRFLSNSFLYPLRFTFTGLTEYAFSPFQQRSCDRFVVISVNSSVVSVSS